MDTQMQLPLDEQIDNMLRPIAERLDAIRREHNCSWAEATEIMHSEQDAERGKIKPRDAITIQGWPVRVQSIGHTWVRLFDGEGTVDYARSLFDREVRAGKIVRVSA
jgi:hypothetical protein